MEWNELAEPVRAFLDYRLFEISGTAITLATLLTILGIIIGGYVLARVLEAMLARTFRLRGVEESGTTHLMTSILRYGILATAFAVALGTAGIDLAALFATGAVFAVVAGFAMQNIAENFVAGVILMAERTLKPGDVIEIDGRVVQVTRLGIRATVVRSRDDEDLIVPNSILIKNTVKNYTLKDSFYRLRTQVGVLYGSDMREVRDTLERTAQEISWRLPEFDPRIFMQEFGNNAVIWELSVWMSDPWRALIRRNQLNEAIWWAFKEKGIVIAFPQLDVHFDGPVVESLGKLSGRAA